MYCSPKTVSKSYQNSVWIETSPASFKTSYWSCSSPLYTFPTNSVFSLNCKKNEPETHWYISFVVSSNRFSVVYHF